MLSEEPVVYPFLCDI